MMSNPAGRFLLQEPKHIEQIEGVTHVCVDDIIDSQNPFVMNPYDYDLGFYQGEFTFESPLDGEVYDSTPETFGRHRAAASLLQIVGANDMTVLDIGCGTLDVARLLPSDSFRTITMINADISGPWSVPGESSSLERGASKLKTIQNSAGNILNVQYDFNMTDWPFAAGCIDVVVTNMAMHHVRPDHKYQFLHDLKLSLKPGATVIVTDVFNKDESGARFTESGKRGPEECGGHIEPVSRFIQRALAIGFVVDEVAAMMATEGRDFQQPKELASAEKDLHKIMAINKAIWYMEFRNVA